MLKRFAKMKYVCMCVFCLDNKDSKLRKTKTAQTLGLNRHMWEAG